jgi:transcriptional regulator with XRE-family HTH domain
VTNSTDDARYKRLLRVLSVGRRKAAITQTDLAKKLRKTQQFVSKYESGERRLDAIEFADICDALGLDPGAVLDEVAPNIRGLARNLSRQAPQS